VGASTRGLLDRRGLIHSHSVYSHDACDNMPLVNGQRDPVCFDDFRVGICNSMNDFVFLTDHYASFAETPFPDNLLYRPERGDTLVQRNGNPVASWSACPDGHKVLTMAGMEAGTMPVGLEQHIDPAIRQTVYQTSTSSAIQALKDNGAVALVAHTEMWTTEQLTNLPLDGFEMYNLHANMLVRVGPALEIIYHLENHDLELMHPNLIALPIISEDPRYLNTWAQVLASGAKRTTTMGCDCHRNAFPGKLADGDRIDSFRRMMSMFSNHLLLRANTDGSWDDQTLKEALRAGRLYGAFEVLGVPTGFDYRAEIKGATHEMGEELALTDAPSLVVERPSVRALDPNAKAPELTIRILLATATGWQEVAKSTSGSLRFTPTTAGAYRAEVRMVPHHLAAWLGGYKDMLENADFVWIYSNAIYVR
jgi:hypothetical protein